MGNLKKFGNSLSRNEMRNVLGGLADGSGGGMPPCAPVSVVPICTSNSDCTKVCNDGRMSQCQEHSCTVNGSDTLRKTCACGTQMN